MGDSLVQSCDGMVVLGKVAQHLITPRWQVWLSVLRTDSEGPKGGEGVWIFVQPWDHMHLTTIQQQPQH